MEELKQYLAESGRTQKDLADELGVSQPTVWEWLNGVSTPKAENLIALARVTGRSVDRLLGVSKHVNHHASA